MSISLSRYRRSEDFHRVGQFLVDTYRLGSRHDNWLQPRWEYMHYHPMLDESALDKIGLWKSNGELVGVAHYELSPGEAYFQVHPDFAYLKPEMLEYAETYLDTKANNGQRKISVWVNDFDSELGSYVRARGYRIVEEARDCWSIFEIHHPFPAVKLPDGFRLRSLTEDNDLKKLDRLIHRGFNHPGEPPEDGVAGKKKMQSAPGYRKDLNILAVDEEGSYASYCGMWQDHVNKIAYVEPVCTDPDYRRMGLGTAVVLEGIRRCGLEGATTAMVGSEQPFYVSIGFKKLFDIHLWVRQREVIA